MHLVQRMQLRVVSSSQNDWPLGASPRYFSINLASDTSPAYHDTPRLHLHSKRDLRGDSIERVSHLSRIKNPRQSPFKIQFYTNNMMKRFLRFVQQCRSVQQNSVVYKFDHKIEGTSKHDRTVVAR